MRLAIICFCILVFISGCKTTRKYYVTVNQTINCEEGAFPELKNTDKELQKVEIKPEIDYDKKTDISPEADLGINPF